MINPHRIRRAPDAELGVPLFEQCGFLAITSSEMPTSHHGMADFTESMIRVAETDRIEHEVLDAEYPCGNKAKPPAVEAA